MRLLFIKIFITGAVLLIVGGHNRVISQTSGADTAEFGGGIPDSEAKLAESASAFAALDSSGNYVSLISKEELVTLPVGVKKEIGTISYSMAISKARFTPSYTEVTAFVRIVIPQSDKNGEQQVLFFGADGVKISHKGGIYEGATLSLFGDITIPIQGGKGDLVLKGGFDMDTGDVTNRTYVTIDCEGFKELGVEADVLFSNTTLEPVDANGKKIDGRVKGSFNTIISDWNDMLVEISLPPFQIPDKSRTDGKGKAGLTFAVNNAVFDFSDLRNSTSMRFPEGYDKYLIPGNYETWKGVYINSLTVALPSEFQKRDSTERVVFEATNLLIDGQGVSGLFAVENILPLSEGNASGWQFSVDRLSMELTASKLVEAGFDGQIVLPISKEVTDSGEVADSEKGVDNKDESIQPGLSYSALIDDNSNEYQLKVSLSDSLSVDIFKAKATFTPNSYITLKSSDSRFNAKAVLHGNLVLGSGNTAESDANTTATTNTTSGTNTTATTNTTSGTVSSANDSTSTSSGAADKLDLKELKFQAMTLQTESPYFGVDYLGYEGEVKFMKFPVSISDISLTTTDNNASLGFGLAVNLMNTSDKGFSGKTNLSLVSEFKSENNRHRWKFKKVNLDAIKVNADMGSIKISGELQIKSDDPTYGDGFYGELDADFNAIAVKASAWFGKKDYRYWYVDAYADLSKMNIVIGTFKVSGFGGGAYYHMTKDPDIESSGVPSGLSYIPDGDVSLGFRALLGFALGKETLFNGRAGFEMEYNSYGGLNRAYLFGDGNMVTPVTFKFGDKLKKSLGGLEKNLSKVADTKVMKELSEANLVDYSKAALPENQTVAATISATFGQEMDFRNKIFHTELEVFVNTPGGFLQGIGPGGRAGWAAMHYSPEEWYFRVGTPQDKIGLKFGFGGFSVRAGAYFMTGSKVLDSPAPPAVVADILGVSATELDYMRDLNALADGSGIALGMDFSLDTGDLSFLMFYARFQAGLGMDIMLRDYGKTACEGSGNIGINGWYANGQAYAYLQGELGIKVKLLFVKKNIPIIKAGAAVLLQAKLPNPAWFRGYVGGNFDLLGGLVKGKFNFKVELGQECEIVEGSVLDGIEIISDITPAGDSKNVDTFAAPQVAFNMPVNSSFKLDETGGTEEYKIILDTYTLTKDGVAIPGSVEWNSENDKATFISSDILPPNSDLKLDVKVHFAEKSGNRWSDVTDNGEVIGESKEVIFTTGDAPTNIPLTNIEYCYPTVDQQYMYKDESTTGYIKLKRGQPYLFAPETDWNQQLYIGSVGDSLIAQDVTYNKTDRSVNYDLPTHSNSREYSLKIVSSPPTQDDSGEEEVEYRSEDVGSANSSENSIEVRNSQAEDVVLEDVSVEIISYNYNTSSYSTFSDKIAAKSVEATHIELVDETFVLQADGVPTEPFGLEELNGSSYTNGKPLISGQAVLSDSYYKDLIEPMLYNPYPIANRFSFTRLTDSLGIPPVNSVNVISWYLYYLRENPNDEILRRRVPFRYDTPIYYRKDFLDIRTQMVSAYLSDIEGNRAAIAEYDDIISSSFPFITEANYKMLIQYYLPKGTKGTSGSVIIPLTNWEK